MEEFCYVEGLAVGVCCVESELDVGEDVDNEESDDEEPDY